MMKKRLIGLLIGILLIVGATVGCTNEEEELASSTMMDKQSTVDVVGAVQIEDELGIQVLLPTTIKKEAYSIIDGEIGLVSFKLDGLAYKYYIQGATAETDLTGVASSLGNQETVLADDATYKIAYDQDGVGVSYWYDKTNKIACTLLIPENATSAALKTMTDAIILVQ